MFSLPDPDYNASFVPLFYDSTEQLFGNNTQLQADAEKVCGKTNFVCLFDFVLTADANAVKESQATLTKFTTEEKVLSKCSNLAVLFSRRKLWKEDC